MFNINENFHVHLESQNRVCNQIIEIIKFAEYSSQYNELDKRLTIINLVGDEGSGKTTICNMLLSKLVNWHVHYIECDENELTESGIRTASKRKESFPVPSASVHFGIFTLGLSQRFQEADSIFNDIEKQFIKEINSDYGKSIIFVENFERADELTQKFVKTICNINNCDRFYKSFPIVFIITSKTKLSDQWNEIAVENLNEEEIIALGRAIKRTDIREDAEKIKNLTDGNIDFVINLLKSNDDGKSNTISSIIDKRLNDIRKIINVGADTDIEDICICGAYFENGFTVKQINKIFPAYTEEFLLKLFIALDEKKLLKNDKKFYRYTIEQFKNELINKRISFAALYFSRMYSFYTNYFDEDYSDRLKFAILVRDKGLLEGSSNIVEALLFKYLITLIYGRQITTIKKLQSYLANYISIKLNKRLLDLLEQLINNNLCRNTVFSISYNQFNKLIQSEIAIVELNYLSRKNARTSEINNALLEAICLADQLEQEQQEYFTLLQLRLTIVNILLNRSTLSEYSDKQIDKLNNILNFYRSRNETIYLEYVMRKNRKSAIYYSCDRSIRDLQDAVSYFVERNNVYEQYYCYVNLLGMFAITSRYNTKEYKQILKNTKKLIDNNHSIVFYKPGKLEHNLLLNNFFKESRECCTSEEYKVVAERYYHAFCQLYEQSNFKTSRLNMVSLLCLFDSIAAQNELNSFFKYNAYTQNLDEFYEYYLNDIQCMIYIVVKEWDKAEQILTHLNSIPLPTFNNCQIHLKKRMDAFRKLIDNKVECFNILEYDNLINKIYADRLYGLGYFFGIDESWNFYSKGFLLTDTQYFT